MPSPGNITLLLQRHQEGDKEAFQELFRMIYAELKRMAQRQLGKRVGASLTPTALVHDAFMKLEAAPSLEAKNRAHFFSIAANCMRWLIADYAKLKKAGKRGAGAVQVTFDEQFHSPQGDGIDISDLNVALEKLERIDPKLSRVVELHFLLGLSIEETAETLQISPATVKRRCLTAKAWLGSQLDKQR